MSIPDGRGPSIAPNWIYPASLLRIIDADTIDVDVDLGFRMHARMPLRIASIDAPERYTDAGKEATAFLHQLLGDLPKPAFVRTAKPADKYGRYLADVFVGEHNIGDLLVSAGHAVRSIP